MMANSEKVTEENILKGTLISPSSLPNIISLKEFIALFPAGVRDHPHIPQLYRALQHDRALDLDFVKENIDGEVRRGERQQRELLRSKIRGAGGVEGLDVEKTSPDGEISGEQDAAMDGVLYSNLGPAAYEPHTLASVLPALDSAIASMEVEISDLEAEAQQLQTSLEGGIGDLSDLRYGKLSRPGLRKEVIESLKSLAAECDRAGANEIALRTGDNA